MLARFDAALAAILLAAACGGDPSVDDGDESDAGALEPGDAAPADAGASVPRDAGVDAAAPSQPRPAACTSGQKVGMPVGRSGCPTQAELAGLGCTLGSVSTPDLQGVTVELHASARDVDAARWLLLVSARGNWLYLCSSAPPADWVCTEPQGLGNCRLEGSSALQCSGPTYQTPALPLQQQICLGSSYGS